jgi:erythronate-4-phosphate dehydrogenase
MLIAADENIPFVKEVFASLGEVRTFPGRAITGAVLRDAELLLVRSVTRVDRDLLEGTRIRFVGTATIGFDHVDRSYLDKRGVVFSSAPGSNARSVAEYVAAALLQLEARGRLRLSDSTLGIVGVGNVGSRVDTVANALGMRVLWNDPPRARTEVPERFVSLIEICERANVISFHVPLEAHGPDRTRHMLDAAFMERLRPGAIVINTSRGAVHDTQSLKHARRDGRIGALVLDVFEGEPRIDQELVSLAEIATPHIAGYSFDGKVAGTKMIYEAACRFLKIGATWPKEIPPFEELRVKIEEPAVRNAVSAAYDIEADDEKLRGEMSADDENARATGFDRMRREYPRRREFENWRVCLPSGASKSGAIIRALGFQLEEHAEKERPL